MQREDLFVFFFMNQRNIHHQPTCSKENICLLWLSFVCHCHESRVNLIIYYIVNTKIFNKGPSIKCIFKLYVKRSTLKIRLMLNIFFIIYFMKHTQTICLNHTRKKIRHHNFFYFYFSSTSTSKICLTKYIIFSHRFRSIDYTLFSWNENNANAKSLKAVSRYRSHSKKLLLRVFFQFCIPHTAGRGNLVLRHFVLHFPPISQGIAYWVAA